MQPSSDGEPEPSVRTTVTMPSSMALRTKFQAQANGRSVSSIVREALQAYLEGQGPPKLPSFVGIGHSGRSDLSDGVEEIIPEHVDELLEEHRRGYEDS